MMLRVPVLHKSHAGVRNHKYTERICAIYSCELFIAMCSSSGDEFACSCYSENLWKHVTKLLKQVLRYTLQREGDGEGGEGEKERGRGVS